MDTDKEDVKKEEAVAKTDAEKDALTPEELEKVSGGRQPQTRRPAGWREAE